MSPNPGKPEWGGQTRSAHESDDWMQINLRVPAMTGDFLLAALRALGWKDTDICEMGLSDNGGSLTFAPCKPIDDGSCGDCDARHNPHGYTPCPECDAPCGHLYCKDCS